MLDKRKTVWKPTVTALTRAVHHFIYSLSGDVAYNTGTRKTVTSGYKKIIVSDPRGRRQTGLAATMVVRNAPTGMRGTVADMSVRYNMTLVWDDKKGVVRMRDFKKDRTAGGGDLTLINDWIARQVAAAYRKKPEVY